MEERARIPAGRAAEPGRAPDREVGPRSGLGGGALFALAAVGLEKVVSLGIALYLPRHLTLPDYGRYALLISYLGFFQALPDNGLEAVLVARLARTPGDARDAAGRGAATRLAVSLLGGGLGVMVLALVTGDPALLGAGAVGAVGLAAGAANPYRVLLRARLRMARYLLLLAGQGALGVAFLAAAVARQGGLVAVLGALTAAAMGGLVLGRALVGRGARLRPDVAFGRTLVAEAWPLGATIGALAGAQQVMQLLLLRLHGASAVGLLGVGQRLIEAVGLLPSALMVSVLPALAAARPAGAVREAREAARVLVIVVAPLAAGLALWASPLLGHAFGAPFVAAAPVLRLLAPVALLVATGAVLTNLLLALGLQRLVLLSTVLSAAVMVALGVLLVPSLGAQGVAAALVIAMAVGQLALLVVPATRAPVAPVLGAVVRPLALAALAAGAVVALGGSLAAGAACLLVGYPLALAVTGTVTREDLVRWQG